MNRYFDLNNMAFTCYGSSLTVTRKQNATMGFALNKKIVDGYYIHPVYDDEKFERLLFRLSFEGLPSIDMQYDFLPEVLKLVWGNNEISVCFPDRWTMRFSGYSDAGFTLTLDKLNKYNTAFQIGDALAELNLYTKKAMLYIQKGTLLLDAPWNSAKETSEYVHIVVRPDENGQLDFSMEEFRRGWTGIKDMLPFSSHVERNREGFGAYTRSCLQSRHERYADAFEACNYMYWAYTIFGNGYMKDRRSILLSKNWMAMSASWDHAFNLLALMENDPQLAFEQIFTLMDYQDTTGALPDWINSHRFNHSYVKPPVHGMILKTLMDGGAVIAPKYLTKVCGHLKKMVDFWFTYRDYDHDGIPEYCHGNDSGEDNCTVFDISPNVEAPDLTAYLIADMDFIVEASRQLGLDDEAQQWQDRADETYRRFIAHSYDEKQGKFVSKISGSHICAPGDALIDYLPIILAKRMDEKMKANLVAGLKTPGRFLTDFGCASESISSEKYLPDSYWRGPIWAPQVYFIVEGLKEAGETELARDIAGRFVNMCEREGFAENFNAVTGEGLRDRSYSWSANVFQYFANRYID